jgi:hypothetical protein
MQEQEMIRRNNKETENDTKGNDEHKSNSSCLAQADHPDRMTYFPGWDQPLPSAWYSGCK